MPRIATPSSIATAPAAAQPMLQAMEKQLGVVPNLFRMVANSPAALEGYLGMMGALAKGRLAAPTRERIALAIAEINGCNYCLSAHSYLGKTLARLDDAEMIANRHGGSSDPKAAAAVRFAASVAQSRGQVGQEDLAAVRLAGYDDGEIIEIVQHVALNVWTNYINEVAQTDIDFPVVCARDAA
ncbi:MULTISPECIES: peroxidase-related enzyme [unclassified Mesorhizobium]|uniref:carboxymuconolactone decarboxylase family protein n=1 Tax=unclassified Mesorhizobium TaxID=325217 RepID=UPI000FD19935|nr:MULTISPECIES: peroxidase-related enzyme [unclassified Mesorhizobium]RVD52064.1 carboxymuconolactone decarboxylase family protein [Mesorhizobium sp. M8A.F.Ca.ET.023.02.2.1]RWC80991.1 MAG: carboxymuconolactone decarboxylase family protein [Mesorhizobium sp.]TGW07645.1 carboxymuconolactone decarboxylase family protein [Mesorhizobium sp. M2D.F.Ca.ET.145.01.1.1]TGQ81941.1 carboxymuconolactone decarboxylase family protein [Mesorhizobium sp. M8A.F.Ca.ET.207.01.1.1]TGT88591.1 carboxymuconolactone d